MHTEYGGRARKEQWGERKCTQYVIKIWGALANQYPSPHRSIEPQGEGEVDKDKGSRINDDRRKFNFSGKHTMQYTYDVLLNYTLETYDFMNQCHHNKFNFLKSIESHWSGL